MNVKIDVREIVRRGHLFSVMEIKPLRQSGKPKRGNWNDKTFIYWN
jgi:hypothetical protein